MTRVHDARARADARVHARVRVCVRVFARVNIFSHSLIYVLKFAKLQRERSDFCPRLFRGGGGSETEHITYRERTPKSKLCLGSRGHRCNFSLTDVCPFRGRLLPGSAPGKNQSVLAAVLRISILNQ